MISSFAPYGPRGASSRVRLYDWFDHFGWEVVRHDYLGLSNNSVKNLIREPGAVLREERALRRHQDPSDITIISREASPLSAGRLEARLLQNAGRGVFDFDDAIYLGGGHLRNVINQQHKTRRAVAAADVVIVGNEVLADWASAHSHKVEVIPSCVNPDDYQVKVDYEIGERPRLIWVGSPSTERYLAEIGAELAKVHELTGAEVIAISGPVTSVDILNQWPEVIHRVEWQPKLVESLLSSADLALAPLASDPYSRGKCAYKLLQYGAAGLPMIGSPVGANDAALDRLNGLKVSDRSEWSGAILQVLNDSTGAREARGRSARAGVLDHYSYAAWSDRWRKAVTGSPLGP